MSVVRKLLELRSGEVRQGKIAGWMEFMEVIVFSVIEIRIR